MKANINIKYDTVRIKYRSNKLKYIIYTVCRTQHNPCDLLTHGLCCVLAVPYKQGEQEDWRYNYFPCSTLYVLVSTRVAYNLWPPPRLLSHTLWYRRLVRLHGKSRLKHNRPSCYLLVFFVCRSIRVSIQRFDLFFQRRLMLQRRSPLCPNSRVYTA